MSGSMPKKWGGPKVMEIRRLMEQQLPQPCGKCGKQVKPGQKWNVGHKVSQWERPDLVWEPTNWQHEHRGCSDSSGQKEVQRKAYAEGMKAAQGDFSTGGHKVQPPPFSAYISGASDEQSGDSDALPAFDPQTVANVPWMADLFPVPADSAWPTVMSPPHPRATGSYGQEAEEWCKNELGITLRWWQRLAMRRQLEHDADGALVWQNVLESTPRRAGKSVRLRVMALWRLDHAEQFGEPQLVLHTGKDLAIVKEIHRAAWKFAEENKAWRVKRAHGHEEMETPTGDRWMVRSTDGVYGYDVTLGMVDEAWAVEARAVDDGLEPALLERVQPQMLLTSTAHRRATSLMKRRLSAAMNNLDSDETTLVLLWCALPDDDFASEESWRRASPHWTEQRRRMIAEKLERALAGEADPEADDLDPLEAFKSQYLNVWQFKAPRHAPGKPVTSESDWQELVVAKPTGKPIASACESWFGQGVGVVHIYAGPGERFTAVSESFTSVAEAAQEIRRAGAPIAYVGKSIAVDAVWVGLPISPKGGTSKQAVEHLKRMLDEDTIRHDASPALTEQVLALRTVPAAEGIRIRSNSRLDAVKALSWAMEDARAGSEEPMVF